MYDYHPLPMEYVESLIKKAPIINEYVESLDSSWREVTDTLKQSQLVINTNKPVIVESDRVKVLLIDAPLVIDKIYKDCCIYYIKESFQVKIDHYQIFAVYRRDGSFTGTLTTTPVVGFHYLSMDSLCLGELKIEEAIKNPHKIIEMYRIINVHSIGAIRSSEELSDDAKKFIDSMNTESIDYVISTYCDKGNVSIGGLYV